MSSFPAVSKCEEIRGRPEGTVALAQTQVKNPGCVHTSLQPSCRRKEPLGKGNYQVVVAPELGFPVKASVISC